MKNYPSLTPVVGKFEFVPHTFPTLEQHTSDESRTYSLDKIHYPSVTTVLGATAADKGIERGRNKQVRKES